MFPFSSRKELEELQALLFFFKKIKITLPQSVLEVKTSRSVALTCVFLTIAVAIAGGSSRSCCSNSFQYWPGKCVDYSVII